MAGHAKAGVGKAVVAGVASIALIKKLRSTKQPRTGGGGGSPERNGDRTHASVPSRSGPAADPEQASDELEPTPRSQAKGPKRIVTKIDRYQRAHPWLGFPLGTVKKFSEDQAGNLAALISYYTFFSLFPLLLALVTILGFILKGDVGLQRRILDSALAQFPVIGNQIHDNVGSLSGNGFALIVGLGGALWAGMAAVDAAQNAMNSVWDVPIKDNPKFFVRRARSFVMLMVIGGGLFATAAASTVASSADSIGLL